MKFAIYEVRDKSSGKRHVGTSEILSAGKLWASIKDKWSNYKFELLEIVRKELLEEKIKKYMIGASVIPAGQRRKNHNISSESRKKISDTSKKLKGRDINDEWRRKISKTKKGVENTVEHNKNISLSMLKPLLKIDKTGRTVHRYESKANAVKVESKVAGGISSGSIGNSIADGRYVKGHKFIYEDKHDGNISNKKFN